MGVVFGFAAVSPIAPVGRTSLLRLVANKIHFLDLLIRLSN